MDVVNMYKKMKCKYICDDCGFKTNDYYKAYEHLNESSEEDKIYQEGLDHECNSFSVIDKDGNKIDF